MNTTTRIKLKNHLVVKRWNRARENKLHQPIKLFETIAEALRPEIKEATEFQLWYAKAGGMIKDDEMEKVIEKFKN